VPRYLEQAMASFARQQEQMRVAMQQTMGNFFPFGMEEVGRQNMAMMERAMSLFSPFARGAEAGEPRSQVSASSPQDEMTALRAEVEFLRAQLARARAAQQNETKSGPAQVVAAPDKKRSNMDTGVD
jgi:polyhydroxyalkanoate synthesis regulator protein